MPTVTNITQQRRRKDRFSIYIDGRYSLSLAGSQLTDAGLRVGDKLAETDIAQLAQKSEIGKALDKAYNYLSFRPRSHLEMVRYFRRKQYDDELAGFLIQRLVEQDLINDRQFAQDWVQARQQSSPRSVVHLRSELREKGIPAEIIAAVLEASDATDEVTAITALITQKCLRQRYPEDQKLTRYLAGKGFGFGAIKAALEQLANN